MNEQESILHMDSISKHFPGVQALKNVSLRLGKGEVLALVGENGAGKSTLIKILSGVYKPDEGDISFEERKIEISSPLDAIELGISTIYQETSLVQELSVGENIFLGRQPTKYGQIDWKSMNEDAQKILDDLGITTSPLASVGDLSVAQQQFVEIAKALSFNTKIIVMDEPTASITDEDTAKLFEIVRRIRAKGTSFIYISHRLKEIFQIADRVMILRDGAVVACENVNELTELSVIRHMIGRDIGNIFTEKNYDCEDKKVFETRNLSRGKKFKNISFELRRGEILGFCGLVGAGRTEIMRAIFGLDRLDNGEIYVGGRKTVIRNSADAIRNGITFVSEDRRLESVIQGFSVAKNISILVLKTLRTRLGFISPKKEKAFAEKAVKELAIRASSIYALAMNLSGGNQQKTAVAKCLSFSPTVMILDEPTKGVDVGAKKEIHGLIKDLAHSGVSFLLVSSELPEIIGMCHRVLVIRDGEISGEFEGRSITEENLLRKAVRTSEAAAGSPL